MSQFIVTLKLVRNPAHDLRAKVIGGCPLSGHECTDQTGEHHSVIVGAQTSAAARAHFIDQGIHVTRIEAVTEAPVLPGPSITDAMVKAADWVLEINGVDLHASVVREVLAAALKAGCTHPRMGAWWPCNFGADEVRACPDCDLIEKRSAKAEEA